MATITKTSTWADDTDSDGEDIPNAASRRPVPVPVPAPVPVEQREPAREPAREPRGDATKRPQNAINPNGPYILFVGNLTFEVTNNDLGNFFHNGGCDVLDVKVQTDRETGRSRGFAHVEMKTLASLERGLTASGTEFMGRRLNVDVGKPPRQNERGGRDRDRGFDKSRDRPARDDNAPFERGVKLERHERPDKYKNSKPKEADAAPAPVERKKYEIKPRTLPIGEAPPATPPSSYSSIFGEAKPRDEKAVEAAPLPKPPAAAAGVEKQVEGMKVSPPVPPAEATADKATSEKNASKERKPTKPTWTENRAGRGEARGRGDGERRDRRDGSGRGEAGRGRGGRGEGSGGRGKDVTRDAKGRGKGDSRPAGPRGNKKADATEEKGGSARPVNTLTEHVPASAVEIQKAVPVKAKNANIFAGLDDSDSEED